MVSDSEALFIATLALNPQSWIHRRVEQIAYLDDRSIRRRISIDFSVPTDWPHEGPLHLPLAQFVKEPLTNFDLVDSSGESIPMLTAAENGRISTAMLRRLARVPSANLVDLIVDRYVERLVFSTNDGERGEALGKIFQPGTTVGAVLSDFSAFRALTFELSESFVLYLPVTKEEKGRRRIIKLSFDRGEPAARPGTTSQRLGFRPVGEGFEVPAAGLAASYHLDLVAPPDLRFSAATFFGVRDGEVVAAPLRDPLTPSAHMNLAALDRSPGVVFVDVRADSAVVTGAAVFAALSAGALCFVLARLEEFAGNQSFDAVVAALLAVPGVALAYIVRPSEHRVATAFLRGYRTVAVLAAITSFVAAMVLFAGYEEATLQWIFRILAGVAGLCGFALMSGWAVQAISSLRSRRSSR